MACSAIYFLDMKGKVLLTRNYRGGIDSSVIKTEECTFAFIKHSNPSLHGGHHKEQLQHHAALQPAA